jgi:sugar phosphate isomerase/epimerase
MATLAGLPRALVQGTVGAPITPGLQLYTVRTEMAKDVRGTLARVAMIGYQEVEFAGYFGVKPRDVAALLKANALSAPSTHVERDAMKRGWEKVLDDAATIGHRWVIVAWVPEADRGSVDAYQRLAAEFNAAAAAASARGLSFAYHNHDFEFTLLRDGAANAHGHAILMKECDPSLVHFELDLYWITRAKQDAVEYVTRHPGRFPLVHVKDMRADGAMTEVGAGTIDFPRIFAAARGGIRHFFVEHDQPGHPLESIRTSLGALRRYSA